MNKRAYYAQEIGLPTWLITAPSLNKTNQKINHKTSKNTKSTPAETVQKTTVLVVEQADNPLSFMSDKNARDLLTKMLLAIDLEMTEVSLLSVYNTAELMLKLSDVHAKAILLMSNDLTIHDRDDVFVCPHPGDLNSNTSLKSLAWQTLKTMKAWLKQTTKITN